MLTTIIRVLFLYFALLMFMRIMGKRQIGEMQPFELAMTLILADLATLPISDNSIPLLVGIIPLCTLVIFHFILTLSARKSLKMREFLSGSPVIVINPNGIDYEKIKALSITIEDIFEGIRGCGYYSLEQIEYAIIETTGKMSVIAKSHLSSPTAEDMKIKTQPSALPITIITDGQLSEKNQKMAKINNTILKKILKKANIKKIEDVIILSIDSNHQVYIQGLNHNYHTFTLEDINEN